MAEKLKYSTGIKTKPFLFVELKKMAKYKKENEKLSNKKLRDKAIKDNVLQFDTDNRNKEVASVCIKRLDELDDFLLDKLLNGAMDVSKQIAIYSILKTDRLFFEFMNEVYRDKFQIGEPFITDRDFNIFFNYKAEQSDKVAGWSDYTYYKLKQVIVRILFEANLIKDQEEREIKRPIMPQIIVEHLEDKGDKKYVQAMLGGWVNDINKREAG